MINAPSLANCSLMELRAEVDDLVSAGVSTFHVDIMDGHYVPNLCFPISVVSDIKAVHPDCTIDAHLMAVQPEKWIEVLAKAGADWVTVHSDSTSFARRAIGMIREFQMRAGVAVNPSQPVDVIRPYVDILDHVVLMAVEPGFSGQTFLPGTLARLEELNALRAESGVDFDIEIDGGMDLGSARECVRRGADVLVTGVFVTFRQPDGTKRAVARFDEEMRDENYVCRVES